MTEKTPFAKSYRKLNLYYNIIGQILELRRYLSRRHPIIYNKDIETDKWVFVQFTAKTLVITDDNN